MGRIPCWELWYIYVLISKSCSWTSGGVSVSLLIGMEKTPGRSDWSGMYWRTLNGKEIEAWKCFFRVTRVQKMICALLCQKMAWRSSHGLDVMGIGNTGFSFEEILHHQRFHNCQTAGTVGMSLPLLAFPWCYPRVKLTVNTPRPAIWYQLHNYSILK